MSSQIRPNDNEARLHPDFREHNYLFTGSKDRRNDATLRNMLPRSAVKARLWKIQPMRQNGILTKVPCTGPAIHALEALCWSAYRRVHAYRVKWLHSLRSVMTSL